MQHTPVSANRPDYADLKQRRHIDSAVSVDQALEEALPDDPSNPSLSTLKNLVRQMMLRQDEYGLILKPTVSEAMNCTYRALDGNPQLATASLVQSLTHTAMHAGELHKGNNGELFAIEGTMISPPLGEPVQ